MKNRTHGATTIEFALGLLFFLMLVLGIVDFARMLFTWSAANEATRAGARYAVVCDDTGQQALVLARMQTLLPQITAAGVAWAPAGCTVAMSGFAPAVCQVQQLPAGTFARLSPRASGAPVPAVLPYTIRLRASAMCVPGVWTDR